MYIQNIDYIIRLADGAIIPNNTGNIDYQDYLNWLDEGNTPILADTPNITTNEIIENIKIERNRRMLDGGYQVDGKWFHSDMLSRNQQIGLVMLGDNIPAGLQWKTMDGTFIDMTPELANKIFIAASISDTNIFQVSEQHILNVKNSPNPFDYDYLTDWPAIFGE